MPNRIEMNVQTGKQTVIHLTSEEIADVQARANLVLEPTPAPSMVEQILASPTDLAALKQALGL